MKRKWFFSLLLLIIAGALLGVVSAFALDSDSLNWWTVDGGGATFSVGGSYSLGASIGQPDAGTSNGGTYTLNGGFWNGEAEVVPPTVLSSLRVNPDPTAAMNVDFIVTFSEDVTGVDTNDFSLTTTGVSGAAVSLVSGTGSAYTVTVNTGSGNGTIHLVVPVSATIVDLDGNLLANLPYTTGEVYIVNKTLTFKSVGANDGWVLESTETSGVGGTFNASATTFNLGDAAADKQYRALLHFDTSSLADNAVITKVTLKIRKQGLVGTNPFSVLGDLRVDMRKPFFGTAIGLVIGDFQAVAGRSAVAKFGVTPVSNWYSAVLNGPGRAYVNKTGTTQFRLLFATDDNNDNGADYMKFFSGNAPAATRPQLIIEYTVP